MDAQTIDEALALFSTDTPARDIILTLCGLLGCGVLYLAMTKRWRVNYGVAPNGRRLMAVPFRAKDVAAERTEFGHPVSSNFLIRCQFSRLASHHKILATGHCYCSDSTIVLLWRPLRRPVTAVFRTTREDAKPTGRVSSAKFRETSSHLVYSRIMA